MGRLYGALLSVTLIGSSLWPAFGEPPRDSFPFSNYPMFARKKGHPLVHRVVGLDSAGRRLRVPPQLIANDEVMQAARTVYHAVRKGRRATARLCAETADRLSQWDDLREVVRLEVISERFDAVRYFTEDAPPQRVWRHARCTVPR